jgi:hypothetical protein
VIVADLNIVSITVLKPEADAPLVVDRNGTLSFAICTEGVKAITRWNLQVIQGRCQI